LELNNNQLSDSIPSLSNFHGYLLNFSNNKLSGNLPSSLGKFVSELYLNNNKLSGNISTLGNLFFFKLDISGNRFSGSIPSFPNSFDIRYLNLSHNYFTFDGMEQIAQTVPNAIYDHQKNIPVHNNGETLSVSAGGTLSNNTYKLLKWEAKGVYTLVATNHDDSIFHPAEKGIYQIKILNSVATGLVLYSKVIYYVAPSNPVIASSENGLQQSDKTNLFRVYPNPAKGILHVETNGSAILSLIDQSGKILVSSNITGKGSINISGITPGLYYLKNDLTGNVQKVMIVR